MTNIINIPTANLSFSSTARSKRVSLGSFNNARQPEMFAETGHSCITKNHDREHLTANLGFMTMQSSKKCGLVTATMTNNWK